MIVVDCSKPGSYDSTCNHIWGGKNRTKCLCCPARCERDEHGTMVAYDACTLEPNEDSDLGYTEDSDPGILDRHRPPDAGKVIHMEAFHTFDWSNAIEIPSEIRSEWVKEILAKFEKDPDSQYEFISSGDSLVVGFREGPTIRILDCKKRTSAQYHANPEYDSDGL